MTTTPQISGRSYRPAHARMPGLRRRAAIDPTDEQIDAVARSHSLDGSMLNEPRHNYWRRFARDVLRQFGMGRAAIDQAGAPAGPYAYEQDNGSETELIYAAWFKRHDMDPNCTYRPLYLTAPDGDTQQASGDDVTYTVNGQVMRPLEYIAYLHDQLVQQASEDARDAHLRELLSEADNLLWIASGAMLKMGLRDRGSDCSLPHEVRKFALEFSAEGREGPGMLQVRGTGRYHKWLVAARAIDAAMQANKAGLGGAA